MSTRLLIYLSACQLASSLAPHSFILISRFENMASSPPVVIPDEKMLRSVSGKPDRISGMNSTLSPPARLIASTRISFRPSFCEAMTFIPDAATVPNISSVAPPNTGSGISENTRLTAGNTLRMMRKAEMKYPT